MSIFNWIFEEKKEEHSLKFQPKITVNTNSNFHVEVEPKDPTNISNIVVTAFLSKQVRSILPIRVEWSRFKVKSEAQHSVQKIHCLTGNTYMCEPGDVGGYIKAVVRSVDETFRAEAQVTIGPIGIDVMMKRLIEGALYSGTLLSQVVVCERDRKNNVTLRLNTKSLQFVDENSEERLIKDFTISQPKIELNPKDSTRVYFRFEQDQRNTVREWLNTIFDSNTSKLDQSKLSDRVPYSSHSSHSTSKRRLFQKSQNPCINKMELRFISRNSRDLFLFTHRAFICRQDMKNSIYLQRIQTLQNIATEQDYYRFLGFMCLKNQIFRLADYTKEVEDDRNAKVKDLVAMEESIGEMTLTYLKIIEEKGKHERVDFEHSYSQISITREEIMNRKNLRELKAENEGLKQRLRQMNEQIELLKFFKKEDNESMIFNQTSNPFAKKNNDLSMSINVHSPPGQKPPNKNMYEMSVNYTKLLEENTELKKQMMNKKKGISKLDRSQNMMEILGDLDEKEERESKILQQQKKIQELLRSNQQLKRKIDQLIIYNQNLNKMAPVTTQNKSMSVYQQSIINNSLLNQSGASVMDSSLNQSITSEAAMMKLEENLVSLSNLNQKMHEDNTRLRRERDHYRNQFSKLQKNTDGNRMDRSNLQHEDSMIIKFKYENETLQNEKNSLLKKLESLSKQNSQGLREEFLQKQRKIKEYEQIIDKIKQQNIALAKEAKAHNNHQDELQFFMNENIKLKKINSELLEQIKSLKIQIEIRGDSLLYNSRVIQLQNEIEYIKATPTNQIDNNQNRKLLDQINELAKSNARLKQENDDKQLKIDNQTNTIEKLMNQSSKIQNSAQSKHASSISTKEKAYSDRCNQPTVQEVDKYKREVKRLQEEIIFMKKSTDAINRSRDLTMEMDCYYEQKLQLMKKQLEALYVENENLSKMCERYGKDARQANKELNKWREKAMDLMKAKTEQHSMLSNDF